MAWVVRLLSALCEAVWATALGASDGLSRPLPTLVFALFLTLSMAGLGWSLKSIGVGTAYAVWTAALTVAWAMGTGAEPADPLRIALLAGIVAAVIGLKFAGGQSERGDATAL